MIKLESNVAKHILVYGTDKGFSLGYINDDKNTVYNVYIRILDNFKFIIAENEKTEEYYALTGKDKFEIYSEYSEAMSGLKDTLNDLLKILKDEKEGE